MQRFYLLVALLSVLSVLTNAFHLAKLKTVSFRSSLQMLNDDNVNDFQQKIDEDDYVGAYSVMKRNPMMPLTLEDSRQLLNNMDNIINMSVFDSKTGNIDAKQTLDIVSFLFKRFDRQNVLKGFGCVNGVYPEKSTDITPTKLTQLAGLSIDALTPKQRNTYWWLIGGGLCLAEIFIGRNVGIDPVFSLIPATILLFGIDAIAYQGAYFESIYQKLFPEYRDKIIHHEAGHFLITYLLGVPIRGCVTNAFDARQKYPDLRGQAGTIYYDTKLSDEIANNKVTRTSLDRMSVITMAGIAAEALRFNKAEGGIVDEQQLISFFTSIQPPWNLLRIQGQARWAVLQAILLIKEHEKSYNALVQALQEGKAIGDCIYAIEANLPDLLPSEVRSQEQLMRNKVQENDAYIRYVQKMTWKVGGVDPLTPETSDKYEIGLDGFIKKERSQDADATTKSLADSQVAIDEGIKAFTDKIKILQQKASTGDLDDIYDNSSSDGVWLNGLNSYNNNSEKTTIDSPSSAQLPQPREGYEEGIMKLLAEENKPLDEFPIAEDEQVTDSVKLIQSIYKDQKDWNGDSMSPESMLMSHRGYQMKRLENTLISYDKEIESITERMKHLTNKVK